MYCNLHSTLKYSTMQCSAEMKMKQEVCNSLKYNTAKSGFARVNFKIKLTLKREKLYLSQCIQASKHFYF